MRGLLVFACRAFPPEHRARQSDEVVDTALLAADGSARRVAREALSLVAAGLRQRLRAESDRSLRDGAALLAGIFALVNLAVALAGIALGVHPPAHPFWPGLFFRSPYVVDWWWIAFAVAAAGVVLGLVVGNRRLALGAALTNLAIVAYDAIFIAADGRGHMYVFTNVLAPYFPGGWDWLAVAVVLALATAVAPPRRVSLWRLPLALAAAVLLVVVSRETPGSFYFLRWPLAAIVVLAMAFGWFAPRLAVLAIGLTLVVVPIVVAYLSVPYAYHAPVVSWVVAPGLALGVVLPLAYLTRRRLA
jgi:hypothetical protein